MKLFIFFCLFYGANIMICQSNRKQENQEIFQYNERYPGERLRILGLMLCDLVYPEFYEGNLYPLQNGVNEFMKKYPNLLLNGWNSLYINEINPDNPEGSLVTLTDTILFIQTKHPTFDYTIFNGLYSVNGLKHGDPPNTPMVISFYPDFPQQKSSILFYSGGQIRTTNYTDDEMKLLITAPWELVKNEFQHLNDYITFTNRLTLTKVKKLQ